MKKAHVKPGTLANLQKLAKGMGWKVIKNSNGTYTVVKKIIPRKVFTAKVK